MFRSLEYHDADVVGVVDVKNDDEIIRQRLEKGTLKRIIWTLGGSTFLTNIDIFGENYIY